MSARFNRRLWGILILAAGLRIGLAAWGWRASGYHAFHEPDTDSYRVPAKVLLREGRFAVGDRPELMRTPGYPLLLALGIAAGDVTRVTVGLQIVLSLVTIVLVARIATILAPESSPAGSNVMLWAAGLLAVEPLSVVYCSRLTSETLFTCLYVASVWCLLRAWRRDGLGPVLGAAALTAAAIYTRPVAYFLPIVQAACFWFADDAAARRRLGRACVYLATVALLIAPWHLRNYYQTGYPGFSTIAAQTRYFYLAAAVTAASEGQSYRDVQDAWGYRDSTKFDARHSDLSPATDAARACLMDAEARAIFRQHPGLTAKFYARGVLMMLAEPGAIDLLKLIGAYPREGGLLLATVDAGLGATLRQLATEQPVVFGTSLIVLAALVGYVLLALGGFLACTRSGGGQRALAWALAANVAYFVAVSGGPQAVGRFRHPIMPLVVVLAALGWRWSGRRRAAVQGASAA